MHGGTMPDQQRFVVTCAARTGSSMLLLFLQSHPNVCAHGEVLAPNGPLNYYGINYRLGDVPLERILMSIRDQDPVAFLHDFVWQSGSRLASGFKGKYEELLLPQYARVLETLALDKSIKVVHLRRDDLLARFLSQYIAINVHGFFQIVDGQGRRPENTVVRLDPAECEADFRRTESRQDRFRAIFSKHETLEITYEELAADPATILAAVQEHIGVPGRSDLSTPSKRLSQRPLHETIENFDELSRHFADTPFSRFFRR